MIAKVIVDISNSEVDRVFDYKCEEIQTGTRVLVPFSNREIEGYVIATSESSGIEADKLKSIIRPLDDIPVIKPEMLELAEFMTEKYHLKKIDALRLFLPAKMRGGRVKELIKDYASINAEYKDKNTEDFIKPSAAMQRAVYEYLLKNGETLVSELNKNFSAAALRNLIGRGVVSISSRSVRRKPYSSLNSEAKKNITLTKEQSAALDAIMTQQSAPVLLHGVTGSGKTEVYMHCIDEILRQGKSAIMLVPEISLTPQVMKNFRSRFFDEVALLHSGLNEGERFDEWRRILLGQARVVVGARSAIFAPLSDIGLIIIDEEHDSSYVSTSNPRYFTHDIALFRKNYNNAKLIMGSATPSIESYYYAKSGKYKLLTLKNRINSRPLPKIELVNMCDEIIRGNSGMFSARLTDELTECIKSGNQAMIFINRRGYSSYLMCRSCGYVAKCEQCDISLVYHKEENTLKCHFCQNRYAALDICPECKSTHIKQGFMGTQRVAEALQNMFPDINILRMDNDTTSGKDAHYKILNDFSQKKAQILVGTQMIAKGHDFADVTLVGIMDADMSLHFSDYRSIERTFQLISQVSGRAGRDTKPGNVVLQTYTPKHYVYRMAVNNDYEGFYNKEISLLQATRFPPFSIIVRILFASENEQAAIDNTYNVFNAIKTIVSQSPEKFYYTSAMRSPKKRLQNKYRMQILMRIDTDYKDIINRIYNAVDAHRKADVACFTEINPNDLS